MFPSQMSHSKISKKSNHKLYRLTYRRLGGIGERLWTGLPRLLRGETLLSMRISQCCQCSKREVHKLREYIADITNLAGALCLLGGGGGGGECLLGGDAALRRGGPSRR